MTAGSLITGFGYGVGAVVFLLAARRRRLATEGIGYVALAGLVGGVLGAKVTQWALVQWPAFAAPPAALLIPWLGGRTMIGGVLTGWLAVEAAKWRLGIRRSTGDLFALALPAGEAVGRIGCFFNECCCGTGASVAWSVFQQGKWRHPAQLYAAAVALLIFGTLWTARDRMPREGDLFRLYLVLFGVGRFSVELVRERSAAFGGLSLAQWVSLELALFGAAALVLSYRRRGRPPLPAGA